MDKGKLLISDGGKGHSAAIGWLVFHIAMAIISFILANTLGITDGGQRFDLNRGLISLPPERNLGFYFFIIIGIWELIDAGLSYYAINRSKITVYENTVVGIGISKWFYLGDIRTFEFKLAVDQVTVSVNGGQMNLHAPGEKYLIYVKNGSKIQNTIFQQKKRAGAVSQTAQVVPATGQAETDPLIRRGFMYLEDSEWDKADNFFEQALNANPENAKAYIGKLCAELHLNREEDLLKIESPLGNYGNYKRAIQFASERYRRTLKMYALPPEERAQSSEESKEEIYQNISKRIATANTYGNLAECRSLISDFEKLGDYKDSLRMLQRIARPARRNGDIICTLCYTKGNENSTTCSGCGNMFSKE